MHFSILPYLYQLWRQARVPRDLMVAQAVAGITGERDNPQKGKKSPAGLSGGEAPLLQAA